jgi:3-hydroxy-9,10-secoandrosta-1,3,5(10)-triene-9,17-dione monooxygenase reductase component
MSKPDGFDPVALRRAYGAFATGIAVIGTHAEDGTPVGMTVNSFATVSLSPPLVSFCPAKSSQAFPVYCAMTHFSVNVLTEEQQAIADRFARSTQGSKWQGLTYHLGEQGVPVIDDALASFECAVEHRMEAGDHAIVLGRVLHIHGPLDKEPLIFHRSRYRVLKAPKTPSSRKPLLLDWDV